jgi:hypothetical protein
MTRSGKGLDAWREALGGGFLENGIAAFRQGAEGRALASEPPGGGAEEGEAGGTAQTGELRKDVPDPVAGFASPANLGERGLVAGGGAGLGVVEAGQGVERSDARGKSRRSDVAATMGDVRVGILPLCRRPPSSHDWTRK